MNRRNRTTKAILLSFLVILGITTSSPAVETVRLTDEKPQTTSITGQRKFLGAVEGRLVAVDGFEADSDGPAAVTIYEKNSKNGVIGRRSTLALDFAADEIDVAVTVGDGLVLLGRSDEVSMAKPNAVSSSDDSNGVASVSKSEFRGRFLTWDERRNDITVAEIPPLPVELSKKPGILAGGARESTLYLAGVDASDAPFFARIDLAKPTSKQEKESAWEILAPYPGPGRRFAASVVQNISTGKAFFLFGGITGEDSTRLTDAVAYDFQKNEWGSVENGDNLPFDFAKSSAVASGSIHIVFPGGVSLPLAQNGATSEVWAYNTITKKLFSLGQIPGGLAPSGPATFWNGHVTLPLTDSVSEKGASENGDSNNAGLFSLVLEEKTNRLSRLNIAIIVAYFLFLIGASLYFLRKMKGTDDYFRGGCRVPWWALGISIYGTITSAITYITVPAKSFMTDWSYLLLGIGPFLAVPILIWFYIPKISRFNFTSAYEYLEYRFNFAVRILGSVIFIVFQVMRIAILLFLPSIALNAITGIDIRACILGVGLAGVFCTLLGGIEIVIWIEVFQVIILLFGFVLALIVAVVRFDGGLFDMLRIGWEDGKFHCVDTALNFHLPTIWVVVIASFFLYIIPYASDQTILQRYFAGKDNTTRSRGVWISLALTVPNLLLLFLAGTLFYVFYKENPRELLVTMNNNDSLMPWFFVSQLPNGLSGFLLLALFTSAMSSVSSGINAISATYTVDIHERVFHFKREKALGAARIVTLVSGTCGILFALAMATWDIASLWDQYNIFIGLVSSGLAGIFFLGVFSKRANTPGVLIGLAVSCAVQYALAKHQTVHLLLYSGTGLVTTILVGLVVSPFFPKKILEDPTVPVADNNE